MSAPAAPVITTQSLLTGSLVSDLLTQVTASGSNLKCYAYQGTVALGATVPLSNGNYYISQTVGGVESNKTAVLVTLTSTTGTRANPVVNPVNALNANPESVTISGVNTQFNRVKLTDIPISTDPNYSPQLAANVQYVKNSVANLIGASAATYDTLTAISNYLANDNNAGIALQSQISTISGSTTALTTSLSNKVDYFTTGTQSIVSGLSITGSSGLSVSAGASTLASAVVSGALSAGASTLASAAVSGALSAGASTLASAAVSGALSAGASTLASAVVNGVLNISNGSLTAQQFSSVAPSSGVDNGGLRLTNTNDTTLSYLYFGTNWRVAAANNGGKLAFQYYNASTWADAVPFVIGA